MSAFYYELVIALIIMGASFLSLSFVDGYATFLAVVLLALTIVQIIGMRVVEGKVNKFTEMDELRHAE